VRQGRNQMTPTLCIYLSKGNKATAQVPYFTGVFVKSCERGARGGSSQEASRARRGSSYARLSIQSLRGANALGSALPSQRAANPPTFAMFTPEEVVKVE
jgi:hypothetical protein